MTDRVREILGWYGGDNPGTLTNLARLFGAGRLAGTGRLLILPIDRGFEHGPARSFAPNPPAYDPRYHYRLAIEAGCSAYAAPLGWLEAGLGHGAAELPLILKLNSHDSLGDERDPTQAIHGSVGDALRLGCVGMGHTVYPGSGPGCDHSRDFSRRVARAECASAKFARREPRPRRSCTRFGICHESRDWLRAVGGLAPRVHQRSFMRTSSQAAVRELESSITQTLADGHARLRRSFADLMDLSRDLDADELR